MSDDAPDIDALCKEYDEVSTRANGGLVCVLYDDVLMSMGSAIKEEYKKGNVTAGSIRAEIASLKEDEYE